MELNIEVTFPKELKEDPIICNLCKGFDITLNIVEASFSTDIGWAILILHGENEDLKKATDYLIGKGVIINKVEKVTK